MKSPPGGFGVYIHFPWCRHRCPYCDFAIAVAPEHEIPHAHYADTVIAELKHRAADFDDRPLETIYIGGGTPSLWATGELERVLDGVRERFTGSPAEVTLEANPSDCMPERMRAWQEAGVTRLSIGAQSFAAEDLVILGRDHSMGEGEVAIKRALSAGFDSLSVDFIISVPGARAEPGLPRAVELGVPHISAYELTVEPRTPLARAVARGEVIPLTDDACAERYIAVHEELEAAGYEHYEVSSFALAGHRARHNSRYWHGLPYLGLGNGAASLQLLPDGSGVRNTNHRSVGRYLAAGTGAWAGDKEVIDAEEMDRDRVWLGLRTRDGIAASALAGAPGVRDWLLDAGLAELVDGRIRPTIRGFLHHNAITHRVVTSLG